jgi:hypothetical protein
MRLRSALSAPLLCLVTSLVLAGGALAKGEEPTAAVTITPGGPDQPTLVDAEIMAGDEPFPLDPAASVFIRATHRETGEVVEGTATETGDGAYTARLDLAQPGAWRIAVGGRYGADEWLFRTASGAEWTLVTIPETTAASTANTPSPSQSPGLSPITGLAAVVAAASLVGVAVAVSRRRQSAAVSG